MEEEGIVVGVNGQLALVRARRGQACEGCGHQEGGGCACELLGPDKKIMQLRALNRAGAAKGDRVMISIGSPSVLKVSALLYIMPLVGLFGGAILGQYLTTLFQPPFSTEVFIGLIGLAGIGVTFFILRLVMRRLENKAEYVPVVTRILEPEHGIDPDAAAFFVDLPDGPE